MKKCLLVMVFVFVFAGMAFALDQSKEPGGFNGIKWGQNAKSVKDLVLIEKGAERDYYKRSTDKMSIGKAELDGIAYVFSNDKFIGVILRGKGPANAKALLIVLKESYGEVPQAINGMEIYNWKFKGVEIVYTYNAGDDKIFCLYQSIS